MSNEKRVALITGCSDGGLGAALCIALHRSGYRVIATARNLTKLEQTTAAGIEHLQLDVLSPESISNCVRSVEQLTGRLDLLVNNAGAGYAMPLSDVDLNQLRNVFELNVYSLVSVTKAFLPLLLKSKEPKVANNISIAAYVHLPVNGPYHASKAAANSITETMRLELKPFGIQVVALITGSVSTNFFENAQRKNEDNPLPEDSIYRVVPGGLAMLNEPSALLTTPSDMSAETWARDVASDLSKSSPPKQIWRGSQVNIARLACHMPVGLFDSVLYKTSKFDEVEKALNAGK